MDQNQPYNRTFYITESRMRMRIEEVPGTLGMAYDLTATPADAAQEGDKTVENQIKFEDVLGELGLINYDFGRVVVNALVTGLNEASKALSKQLGVNLGLEKFRGAVNRAPRKDRMWRHDTPEHVKNQFPLHG